ncbi:hypothetical protein IX321_000264 [Bacteroides pyogenes]|nr:hypothetical protein [Bacteroides pyogenes]MBR8716302.1 hypothetical protein [Bacteroides pyogenes]MBR8745762.1 hypothetical protein [Bacteroides pyogenes]MBR8756138.1 hypothetical protein [Bacteroides pyogenes]MBR8779372.1 hypothetical protein [Bacteroides pyogenes]
MLAAIAICAYRDNHICLPDRPYICCDNLCMLTLIKIYARHAGYVNYK